MQRMQTDFPICVSLSYTQTVWEGKKLFPLLSYSLFIEAGELT